MRHSAGLVGSRPMAVNIAESDEEKACKELIRCSVASSTSCGCCDVCDVSVREVVPWRPQRNSSHHHWSSSASSSPLCDDIDDRNRHRRAHRAPHRRTARRWHGTLASRAQWPSVQRLTWRPTGHRDTSLGDDDRRTTRTTDEWNYPLARGSTENHQSTLVTCTRHTHTHTHTHTRSLVKMRNCEMRKVKCWIRKVRSKPSKSYTRSSAIAGRTCDAKACQG